MTQKVASWRDSDVGLEVSIDGPPRSVKVRSYTQLLDQVLLSLEEVDRFAMPGRVARLEWIVSDLSIDGGLRAVIAPRRIPPRRPLGTVSAPALGLVAGIRDLHTIAEIPPLFSATTVERVGNIGKPVGIYGVERVGIRPVLVNAGSAVVDADTVTNARDAIDISRRSWGSIQGRLDVISARSQSGLRAQVLNEETRRAVTVRAAPDQADTLRNAWGKRVLIGGELQRNAAGQPIRLDMTEIRVLKERTDTSAFDILGISPGWTGDMTTDEYIQRVRSA